MGTHSNISPSVQLTSPDSTDNKKDADTGPKSESSPVPSTFYDLLNEAHEANTLRSIRQTWSPATQSSPTFSAHPTSAPQPKVLADKLSVANRALPSKESNSQQQDQYTANKKTCGVSVEAGINTSSGTTA